MSIQNAKPPHRRAALVLGLAALAAPAFAQQSGSWPSKPVTIIIPNVSGSGSESEARVYAEKLAETFRRPFVMDYKPGAGGTIAATFVAKAAPDGYTLLCQTTSFVVAPAFYPNLAYDPLKDIAPIALMSTAPVSLLAHPSFPARNMKEYIAYAKANPGKILWGTSGAGGSQHLSGVWLHDEIGASATYVHYKGGSQAAADLMAGRINVAPRSLANSFQFVKAGKMKVIGVLAAKRDPMIPDVGTAQEAGIKDFEQPSFWGMGITGGTDRVIVNRLSTELMRIAKLPDVQQKIEPGTVMVGSTPAEYAKYLATQINVFKRIVKENNIKEG